MTTTEHVIEAETRSPRCGPPSPTTACASSVGAGSTESRRDHPRLGLDVLNAAEAIGAHRGARSALATSGLAHRRRCGVVRATIAAQVGAAGERAERAAVLRAEAGGAERVGDRRGRVLHQQGALQAGGHLAGEPAGADLERGGVGQRLEHASRWRGRGAGPRRGARPTSMIQASSASGSRDSARSTSSALTLPEPSQMEFSGDSRNSSGIAGLLDVAVAAQALQRLGDHHRRALAHPELRQRQRDPAQRRLVRVVRGVDGGGQPDRRARSPPPTRRRGRRSRSASAACRRAGRRTPTGARRARTPRPAPAASATPSRARSRAGSRPPSR